MSKSLFEQGKFAECVAKCEAELRVATTAAEKFQLNVLASRAAFSQGDFGKAISFGEMAVKIDDAKMPAWQALSDAYKATNDPRLGDSLSKQMKIAASNKALDRAFGFAKDAAKAYASVESTLQALERWRDAITYLAPNTTDFECSHGLITCLEKTGRTIEADALIWELCESKKDPSAPVRYLSRPAYVILEARRLQSVQKDDIRAAWGELDRRRTKLDSLSWPEFDGLLFAVQKIYEETLQPASVLELGAETDGDKAEMIINKGSNQIEGDSSRARALFCLARCALADGDVPTSLSALAYAEQLEQIVFGRAEALREQEHNPNVKKPIMIGAAPVQQRPFTGNEISSLVCARTAVTHLTSARCHLAMFPEGIKRSLKAIERHLRDASQAVTKNNIDEGLNEYVEKLTFLCEWTGDLIDCSKGCGPLNASSVEVTESTPLESLLDACRKLQVSRALLLRFTVLARENGDFLTRRLAYLGYTMCRSILADQERSVEGLSMVALPSVNGSSSFRRVLENEGKFIHAEDGYNPIVTLWEERFQFVSGVISPPSKFQPDTLIQLAAESPFPLAFEIIGKYYMGLSSQSFLSFPTSQPPKDQVINGKRAVQSLQEACRLDLVGLGAIAPLANAYHAANEELAAKLYQSVADHLLSSNKPSHPLIPQVWSFIFTRLAQQQLHQGKQVEAASNFNRALLALGRAETSRNVEAWAGLGESHLKMGRLDASAQSFERAIELLGNDEKSSVRGGCLIKLASIRNKMGQPILAGESLRLAAMTPLRSLALMDLAETLLEQGHFYTVRGALTSARRCFEEAKQLFRDQLDDGKPISLLATWKGLGDASQALFDERGAKMAYLQACMHEPWNALPRFDLARQLYVMNDRNARQMCDAALVLDPEDGSNWTLASLIADRKDALIRQHDLVRGLQLNPAYSSIPWLNLGWTFTEANRLALAKRAFAQAQTVDADSSAAWLGLAKVHEKENKASIAALECAVDSAGYGPSPTSLQAMLMLARRLIRERKMTTEVAMKVLDVCSRAIQMQGIIPVQDTAEAFHMQGLALKVLNVPRQAEKQFEESIRLFESIGDLTNANRTRVNLGSVAHDPADGLRLCRLAQQQSPSLGESPIFYGILGMLLSQLGDVEGAVEAYEKAVALDVGLETMENKRRLCQSRLRWASALVKQGMELIAFEVGVQLCEDVKDFPEEERLGIYCDVAEIAPQLEEFILANFIHYPPLTLSEENVELRKKLVRIMVRSDKYAVARFFPWEVDEWYEHNVAAVPLRMYEDHPPLDCTKVGNLARMVLGVNDGHRYWTHRVEMKLTHLCPWMMIS